MKKLSRLLALALIATGCSIGSSSNHGEALLVELASAGRVSVSPDNPFIASNLYLSRESERSDTLRGFLEHRGQPSEIELTLSESEEPDAKFYYDGNPGAYQAYKRGGEWIILSSDNAAHHAQRTLGVETLSAQTRKQTPAASRAQAEREPKRASSTAPKSKDAKASLKQPQAFTLEASGDVIHRVTYPGETLRLIVSWYTGDVDNIERIIRINSIDHPNMLKLGQNVRIPRYLLTNPSPLSESDVEAYRQGKF